MPLLCQSQHVVALEEVVNLSIDSRLYPHSIRVVEEKTNWRLPFIEEVLYTAIVRELPRQNVQRVYQPIHEDPCVEFRRGLN